MADSIRGLVPRGGALSPADWEQRHRGLLAILWLHAFALPLFALASGYGVVHSLTEGAVLAALAVGAQFSALGRVGRAAVVSVGLLTSSALLVHVSGGYIEFHFHFFVMILVLALYQHWLPFGLAIAYVVVHHGLAGVLKPDLVYNHPDAIAHPWKWAAIHGGFVLAASVASLFAWRVTEQEQKRRQDLQQVTEAMLARLPVPELLEEVLGRIRSVVGADVATISLLQDNDELMVRAALGTNASSGPVFIERGDGAERDVITRGEPVVLEGVDYERLLNPVYRQACVRALAVVPLIVEGEVIGVLDVGALRARSFSPRDLELLQLAADRIAPAIDRARLYEREHGIAETLQRSLLPRQLRHFDNFDVAVSYQPAGEGVEAGGDWYDVFELPNGRLAVAIGDIAGHGTEAASLMGKIRIGVRAYAAEGHAPGEVLRRLERLLHELGDSTMSTLLYMEVDPADGGVRYVAAGHPPPLLRSASGAARYLMDGRGPPMSVMTAGVVHGHDQLEPGDSLVLYTDGLIERRTVPIDTGLAKLEGVVAASTAASAQELSDEILDTLVGTVPSRDDVALLVLSFAGAQAGRRDDALEGLQAAANGRGGGEPASAEEAAAVSATLTAAARRVLD